jgi:hypothetical protein
MTDDRDTPNAGVEVTQADRAVAAEELRQRGLRGTALEVLRGERDLHPLVQAAAKSRLAHAAPKHERVRAIPPAPGEDVVRQAYERIETAARAYFNGYVLDEATDQELTGIDDAQYLAAVELGEALADLSLARPAAPSPAAGEGS